MPTAARILAERLYKAGCRHAFGIPGGEVLTVLDALSAAGIAFHLAKHENAASFMAEGSYHVTGAPGILLATLGPGVANAVNVVANAAQDRVPLTLSYRPRRRGGGCRIHPPGLRSHRSLATRSQGELDLGRRRGRYPGRQSAGDRHGRPARAGSYRRADVARWRRTAGGEGLSSDAPRRDGTGARPGVWTPLAGRWPEPNGRS